MRERERGGAAASEERRPAGAEGLRLRLSTSSAVTKRVSRLGGGGWQTGAIDKLPFQTAACRLRARPRESLFKLSLYGGDGARLR